MQKRQGGVHLSEPQFTIDSAPFAKLAEVDFQEMTMTWEKILWVHKYHVLDQIKDHHVFIRGRVIKFAKVNADITVQPLSMCDIEHLL